MNTYIAQQRAQFKSELLNQPTRDEIAAMMVSEDENNPVPVLESLLNRTLYLKSHGVNHTLHQMLFSRFYGPINRGKLPGFVAEVQRDSRLRQKMYAAIDAVLAGSDIIRGHTDQGLPSDPGGRYEMAHSHVMIGGEVFGDWGGGPGSYTGAATWRQAFEAKAYAPASDGLSPAGYPTSSTVLQQSVSRPTFISEVRPMEARIALIGGQGYPLTETQAGLPTLKTRLNAAGVDTGSGPFPHTARQQIRDWLHGYKGFRGLIGDSLGAGASAIYAGDLDGTVDFVGGFQPSAWDPEGQGPISARTIVVADNVSVAHCIWNPWWVETGGLGAARFVIGSKSKTILTTTEHHGAHPDDWGWAQDLMLNHLMHVIGQTAK